MEKGKTFPSAFEHLLMPKEEDNQFLVAQICNPTFPGAKVKESQL